MAQVIIGNNTGDDFLGLQDNRIDTIQVTYNHGLHTHGYAGHNGSTYTLKELQRWLLDDIPAGASCDTAVLSLYDNNWASRTADCTITIYQIAAANTGWVEGTQSDGAEVGSPCWGHKIYNSVTWAGSDGCSTADTDYINTSLGSAVFTDGVSGYRTITFNAAGKLVLADWFGDATNDGLILTGAGSGAYWTEWESRQGDDGKRPFLTINYTVGGGLSILQLAQSLGGNANVMTA